MTTRSITRLFDDGADGVRGKVVGIYVILIALNCIAWMWALMEFHDRPELLGLALLAYSFGLRHAFDADHIAAIDNVTRKLMQQKRRPISVGFFFALGHSTIVVGLAVGIALATVLLQNQFSLLKTVGGTIGTSISAVFLFAIAAANIVVFLQVYRAFQKARRGGGVSDADVEDVLNKRGIFGRLLRPAMNLIERSWHMYPLGALFGLGFDTATEVGLLGIAAVQAAQGLPLWSILVFPLLFTAGMLLVDTTDSTIMVGAYGWAFVNPIRKLYYNMTITLASVVAALVVGGVEALGLIVDKFGLEGPVWSAVGAISENFGTLGYWIVGFFVVSWLVSYVIFKVRKFDRIEVVA